MSVEPATVGSHRDPVQELRSAVGEDLRLLALLHDRELDRELLTALQRECSEGFLGLLLQGERGRESIELLLAGLNELPAQPVAATLDRLAAEYADIYLNNGYHASPCESVWLDDDGLIMQEPMFQIRDWYKRHGLAVADWRMRTDDHLVSQLQFVVHLFELDQDSGSLDDAARFLDEHLLRWIEDFAQTVASRCETQLYAGLVLLTAAYLDELRDLLADVLDSPRPTNEEIEERMRPKATVAIAGPAPYVPGAEPSW